MLPLSSGYVGPLAALAWLFGDFGVDARTG